MFMIQKDVPFGKPREWPEDFTSRSEAAKRFRELSATGKYERVTLDAGKCEFRAKPVIVWTPHTGTIYRNAYARDAI